MRYLHAFTEPRPWRLQRTQEVQDILLLAGTEICEVLHDRIGFAALTGVSLDGLDEISRAAIMQQKDPLSEAPKRRSTELIAASAAL